MEEFNPCIFIASHIDIPIRIKLLCSAIKSAINTNIPVFASVSHKSIYDRAGIIKIILECVAHLPNFDDCLLLKVSDHQRRQFQHIKYMLNVTAKYECGFTHIIFLDDDDMLHPDSLEFYRDIYIHHPDKVVRPKCLIARPKYWKIFEWEELRNIDNLCVRDVDFSGMITPISYLRDFIIDAEEYTDIGLNSNFIDCMFKYETECIYIDRVTTFYRKYWPNPKSIQNIDSTTVDILEFDDLMSEIEDFLRDN